MRIHTIQKQSLGRACEHVQGHQFWIKFQSKQNLAFSRPSVLGVAPGIPSQHAYLEIQFLVVVLLVASKIMDTLQLSRISALAMTPGISSQHKCHRIPRSLVLEATLNHNIDILGLQDLRSLE